MANYKRVISYMYQYRNQEKGNNVGFARIETRDTQCKITINIRVPNMKEQDIKSYMYCWYNREMHGVLLGSVHINNGVGELVVKTDVDNIMSSKYRLSDMGGIILYASDSWYLGTEWDGRAVLCNGLFVDTQKPKDFVDRINKETPEKEATKQPEEVAVEREPVQKEEEKEQKVVPFRQAEEKTEELKGAVVEEKQPSLSMEELIEDEVAKEELNANTMTAAVAEAIEKEEKPVATEEAVKEEQVAEQALSEKEAEDGSFPLSKEKIENLDKQAQELFGAMLFNTFFPEKKKEEEKVKESPNEEVPVRLEPAEQQVQSEQQVQTKEVLKINPKSAIECFTAFRSCESKEEYEEIQEEIETMKAEIKHLELLSKEWRIKEERLHEQEEERAISEQDKIKLEEEARKSYHIDGIEGDLEAAAVTGNVVSRIFSKYPAIQPFKEGEVEACIRIEPQDLGIFPMENWILANNSFLLHGYYSYRHLIFLKTKEDGRDKFLLGVPGVNHSRERFMANMFGFNEFRSLADQQEENGEFGYWCQEIKMHV